MGLKMKHKIRRKGVEKRRKMRKEIRTMKKAGIYRKKKNRLHIPNLFPHKLRIIEAMERRKNAELE
jgi:hypothetical protein